MREPTPAEKRRMVEDTVALIAAFAMMLFLIGTWTYFLSRF